jgi:excisionase family DNA binding protein
MPEATETTLQPEFLTVAQAANTLQVCKRTIYRMLDDGRLPYMKARSMYRIPRSALVPDPGGFVATAGKNTPEPAE